MSIAPQMVHVGIQRRIRRLRRGERGFTLIELVVATGYFLFGLSGIMLLQVAAANGSSRAQHLMMATTLCANALETVRGTPAATLAANPSTTLQYDRYGVATSTSGGKTFFTVLVNVTAPTQAQLYSDVRARVTWTSSVLNPFVHGVTMQTRVAAS